MPLFVACTNENFTISAKAGLGTNCTLIKEMQDISIVNLDTYEKRIVFIQQWQIQHLDQR